MIADIVFPFLILGSAAVYAIRGWRGLSLRQLQEDNRKTLHELLEDD